MKIKFKPFGQHAEIKHQPDGGWRTIKGNQIEAEVFVRDAQNKMAGMYFATPLDEAETLAKILSGMLVDKPPKSKVTPGRVY